MPTFYATASAGTEELLAAEIIALPGCDAPARHVRAGKGGVRFSGELGTALATCLWSRTAMRVLLPVGSFEAKTAEALYAGVRAIDWSAHLTSRHTFAVEATGKTEALRHTHFTALKVKDAIVDSLRDQTGARPNVDVGSPDVRVVAHLSRDRCDLSLDISGEPLFKRGYRREPVKASLKENLAAAVLLAAGYEGTRPLHDPLCGAGTLAIEAALIAKNRAPGLQRPFGIERWPSFDARQKEFLLDLRATARRHERAQIPLVRASDRDPEAVAATRVNVQRAGLSIDVLELDARGIAPLDPPGFIVANPPYGERLDAGGKKSRKTFFWQLGQKWRAFAGHRLALLAGGPELESAFGLKPVSRRRLWNGPIPCELLIYEP